MIGVGLTFAGERSCPIPTLVKAASGATISSLKACASDLVWIESGNTIKSMPIAGGSVVTLASGISPQGLEINFSGNTAYWTDSNDSINRVNVPGGGVTQISASFGSGQSQFRIDPSTPNFVYLRNGLRVGLGGTVTTIFTASSNSGGFAIDSTNAYWAEATFPGNLKKVALSGGTVTTLVSNALPPPFWIASDGSSVYWATHGAFGGPFTLSKVSVAGGSSTSLSSSFIQAQILADNLFVYFHDDSTGSISKIKTTGGNVNPIAVNMSPYNTMNNGVPLTIHPNTIFWVNFDNSIWKIDKCSTIPV